MGEAEDKVLFILPLRAAFRKAYYMDVALFIYTIIYFFMH